MNFLLATISKEIKRRFNDPISLLMWLMVPLILGGLLSSVMGGGSGPSIKAQLLLTDLDNTFISQQIPNAMTSGDLADLIEVTTVGLEEGKALINDGKGSAHLVIGKGFTDAFLDKEPFTLQLTVNPAQRISPRIIRDVLNTLLDMGHYVQVLLGDEISLIIDGNDNNLTAAGVSEIISSKMERAGPYIFPPVIEVVDETPEPEGQSVSFSLLMFPGILLMAVIFAGQDISSNYWKEREKGTLGRWRTTPNRGWIFWGGQYIAAMLLLGVVSIPLLLGGFFLLDVPWVRFLPSLLWLMLTGPLLFSFLTVVQVLAPSRRAGNVMTTLLVFPLMMVGGSFFPRETMPSWLAPLADFTPNGRILEPLKTHLIGQSDVAGLFSELLPLMAATVLLIFISSILVEKKAGR